MNLSELLAELPDLGVKLWTDGEQLRIRAPKGRLTPDLRNAPAANKAEILLLLRNINRSASVASIPLEPVPTNGHLSLSFAQERLRFLDHLEGPSAAYNLPGALELSGLTLTPLALDSGTAKFDLTLSMSETEEGLVGSWEYSTDLFEAAPIRRTGAHSRSLLEGMGAHPEGACLSYLFWGGRAPAAPKPLGPAPRAQLPATRGHRLQEPVAGRESKVVDRADRPCP